MTGGCVPVPRCRRGARADGGAGARAGEGDGRARRTSARANPSARDDANGRHGVRREGERDAGGASERWGDGQRRTG